MKDEQEKRIKLPELIEDATRPLDVNFISEKLGLGWWPAYRLITGIFLEEVQQHPEIMEKLSFVCLRSTKGLLVMPYHLLPCQGRGDHE